MTSIILWDLLPLIKDVKPSFMIFINGEFNNLYTLEEIATNNDVNQHPVRKIHTTYGDGKTTYIIDCE